MINELPGSGNYGDHFFWLSCHDNIDSLYQEDCHPLLSVPGHEHTIGDRRSVDPIAEASGWRGSGSPSGTVNGRLLVSRSTTSGQAGNQVEFCGKQRRKPSALNRVREVGELERAARVGVINEMNSLSLSHTICFVDTDIRVTKTLHWDIRKAVWTDLDEDQQRLERVDS